MTAQYVYDSGLGANEVGATMKVRSRHLPCSTLPGAASGAVIVLLLTDRTKPIDACVKRRGGCGVKDNYWDQGIYSSRDITNSYGGGGYTSYLSRSTQPNGPQKASCEGTGADVKAWICCSTECV